MKAPLFLLSIFSAAYVTADTKDTMINKQVLRKITASTAPEPIGPYSHAIEVSFNGKLLFISGQIPLDIQTGKLVEDVPGATKQVMNHLQAILTAANMNFDNVVKTTILLTDMADFPQVNEIYGSYFINKNKYPARETYAVKALPRGARLEISMTAAQPS